MTYKSRRGGLDLNDLARAGKFPDLYKDAREDRVPEPPPGRFDDESDDTAAMPVIGFHLTDLGNAERLCLSSRCSFVACNIADALQGRFDLIVSNPPYIARGAIASIDPEVRDYDPRLALDGGADGLDAFRAIAAACPALLAPGGRLVVELGLGQGDAVGTLFEAAGLAVRSIKDDLGGIPRALTASLRPGQAP